MPGAAMPSLAPSSDFPLLARRIEDRRVVYLDSAATTLKPRSVIDAVVRFYEHSCANIHRGNHTLSQEASESFEAARDAVARLVGASGREIVFTGSATESLNLVAQGLGIEPGDNVVSSVAEHHSNLLPWMSRCEVRWLPEGPDGYWDLSRLAALLDGKTRLLALGHVSNVTGAIQPIAEAVAIARGRGVPVIVDGSQSVPHLPVDVAQLDCDFLAFSGHKMLGPSGVGVLYLAERIWDRIRPTKLGGGTVDHVRLDGFDLKRVPHCFEAGTPNIEGVIGLGAAVDYLERLGMERVREHDAHLALRLRERFADFPGLVCVGPQDPARSVALISLSPTSSSVDAYRLGMILSDSYKVMARAGTHCAHPFFASRGSKGSLRLSSYVYTSDDDIDLAAQALGEVLGSLRAR